MNYQNLKELSKKSKNYMKFLDDRSDNDKIYIKKYDTIALNTTTGPSLNNKEDIIEYAGPPNMAELTRLYTDMTTQLASLQTTAAQCSKQGVVDAQIADLSARIAAIDDKRTQELAKVSTNLKLLTNLKKKLEKFEENVI